jgi:antitoxin component of MazEF toxin-antitoxin module
MVKIRRKVYASGGTAALGIPKDICEGLNIKPDSEVFVDIKEGGKHKYGVFWPVEDDDEEKKVRK